MAAKKKVGKIKTKLFDRSSVKVGSGRKLSDSDIIELRDEKKRLNRSIKNSTFPSKAVQKLFGGAFNPEQHKKSLKTMTNKIARIDSALDAPSNRKVKGTVSKVINKLAGHSDFEEKAKLRRNKPNVKFSGRTKK